MAFVKLNKTNKMETNKNLDLKKSQKKVNIGAKVAPEIRFDLERDAKKNGMTLSSHIELIAAINIEEKLNDLEVCKKKIADLEKENAYLKNLDLENKNEIAGFSEKLKALEVDSNIKVQEKISELLGKQMEIINEKQELIKEKEKYFNGNMQNERLFKKIDMLRKAVKNSGYVFKTELEDIFGITFDQEDIEVDGYCFHRYLLNHNKYIISN